MLSQEEIAILLVFTVLAIVILYPQVFTLSYYCGNGSEQSDMSDMSEMDSEQSMDLPEADVEGFTTQQQLSTDNGSGMGESGYVSGYDPSFVGQKTVRPMGKKSDYETIVYDNSTGAIMTGSQFIDNTGIIAPLWVPPAWDPDAYGPSSKGELDPSDYKNDPRMLYNKCSLSCCSPQYPTPFSNDGDPFVCDKDGDSKYLASDYTCQNNTGGIGCLCMSQEQVDGASTGYA